METEILSIPLSARSQGERPRIVYLIPNDWYFWTHRLHLARAARDAGYSVTIAALGGEYVERILAEGFDFHPLKLQRLNATPFSEVKTILDIVALHRRLKPAVVHQVTLRVVLYGSIAARLTRTPTVNAITGLGYLFTANGYKEKVVRHLLSFAYRLCFRSHDTCTIFQNEDDREFFVRERVVDPAKTVLIPGAGVDTERFSPVEEPVGEPVILLTARMIRDKGIGELVEASRILKARGCKAHIVLAGMLDNGNPTAISEKEIRGWEQEGLIEWLGPRTDIPLLLANCNIVCLPSYREGLPLSLIEAASAGRAIVTTNVPGCRDIVKDGWNGILVPARNAEALADALQRLLESPEERRRMGINGREKVLAGFTRESVAKETLKVYERVARFVRERENSPS